MKHITATSRKNAWNIVNDIFPTDYEENARYSANAGYPIYTSTADGENAWISDLGCRIEVNFSNGDTVMVDIEEEEEEEYGNDTAVAGELTRGDFCDILLSVCNTMWNFKEEAANAEDIETRKRAVASAAKWERVHKAVKKQLDAWDIEHGHPDWVLDY